MAKQVGMSSGCSIQSLCNMLADVRESANVSKLSLSGACKYSNKIISLKGKFIRHDADHMYWGLVWSD